MQQLSVEHDNFHYTPCISSLDSIEGYAKGRANEVALSTLTDLKDWRIYLCGHPGMVADMKRQTFLKGASMSDIYTDAFVLDEAV